MDDLLAHFAADRPGRGEEPCSCCRGTGEHGDRSECDRCDGSGRMHRGDDAATPWCPGRQDDQPAPAKRRHWREPKTAARRDPYHGEGPWYHGTPEELEPGAVIQPGDVVGKQHMGRGSDSTRAWVTNDAWKASSYGTNVYEVEPSVRPKSMYARHHEHYLPDGGTATVLRQVPYAEATELSPEYQRGKKAMEKQIRQQRRQQHEAAGPEDYGLRHRPMEHGAPVHDLTGESPDADFDTTSYHPGDYLTHPQYNSDTIPPSRGDYEALAQMRRVRGKPGHLVDIYRASHHSAPHEMNTGDWVSLSRSYARQHAYAESGSDDPEARYVVHHARVPAKHVRDAGSGGYREQGYWGPSIGCCGHVRTAVLPMPEYGPEPERHYAPEDWPQDKRDEHNERMFEASRQWKAHIKRGLSLGHITADQAKSYKYYFGGHETDDRNNPKWRELPHDLYHVTTDEPSVRAHGLKTRQELSQIKGGHGLGGGEDDTISFAADKGVGHNILRALHEFHGVVNGRYTPAQMWEDAKAGKGADRPFHEDVAHYHQSGWKDGDPLPQGLKDTLEGKETKRGGLVYTREEMEQHHGPGWEPDDEGLPHNKDLHYTWRRDADPDTRREQAASFYKNFAVYRQHAGGPEDPMFFATDTKAFAAKDPRHFALLHVHPKPGAQGYPVSALSEWRTGTGDAVQVHHSEHLEPRQQHAGAVVNFAPYSHLKFVTSAWEKTSSPVPAAERTESVAHMLAHYKPYDFGTWDEVRDNTVWDHPKIRAFVDDVRRNGVRRPIPVDYEQDPPQVRNGHTRLLAAERAGVTHVPTRQHQGWLDPDDPGNEDDEPEPKEGPGSLHYETERLRRTAGNPDEYGMGHKPDTGGPPLHDLLDSSGTDWGMPPDIYENLHQYNYGEGNTGWDAMSKIRKFRDQPEKRVRIWRSAPAVNPESRNNKRGEINHGDWVALSREKALRESYEVNDPPRGSLPANHPNRYHIWSALVPAKHVRNADGDITEWGYSGPDIKDIPHSTERCSHRARVLPEGAERPQRAPRRRSFEDTDYAGKGHYGARREAVLPMPGLRNPHTGGDEWFHGSQAHPGELSQHGFVDPADFDDGAFEELQSEPTHHWNALLGNHFTADHDVAKEFAGGEHSSGASERHEGYPGIVHARLGIRNPKIYASEHDMDHEAYEHEYAAGNHPSNHVPGLGKHGDADEEDDDELYEAEEMWPHAHQIAKDYGHDKIPESTYGHYHSPFSQHPMRTAWLSTHPDRWGIADRFRKRLQDQGHDGIIYGNEYERSKRGSDANKSAIVFDPDSIHVTQHHEADSRCLDPDEAQRHQAAWTPTERIFGPTYGLDHRLFTADEQLKPQVRQALLGRLQGVLEPLLGPAWDVVTRVYLAGSQASRWTSPQLEGNGDLDVLIGVAYSYARQESKALEKLTDLGIDKHLNAALQQHFNAPGWHPPFDPGGTYDLTGYVNHNALDIRVIKPYAAYDLTADDWAVRPPDLPDWSAEKFPQGPAIFQEARALVSQVRAILRLPEPFRSQEAKRIWGYLHEGRNRAFSSEGEGWIGTGNVLEKALDQASGKLIEKLKALNYGVPGHAPVALGHGMTTDSLEPARG